jgi:hypothetical protein
MWITNTVVPFSKKLHRLTPLDGIIFYVFLLKGSEFMSDLEKIKLVKPPFPKLRCFSFKPIII